MDKIETVIVGGGPAGLATSYELTRMRREHIVLEQADRPVNAWRTGRWDSFTLVTPNWSFRLPGAEYDGSEPDGYLPLHEVVARFDRYVDRYQLPIRCNTRVTAVKPLDRGGYRVLTEETTFEAKNVVMATGLFQQPKVPPFASSLTPAITQLHSGAYRNPGSLPAGAVLVAGSGQSGCQIADELSQSGRRVSLCTSSAGRWPRRYRGKDVFTWQNEIGYHDRTPEQLPPGATKFGGNQHVSGKNGGKTINLHQFARDGVTLLGHLRDGAGDTISLAPTLHENLAKADAYERRMLDLIDGYIRAHGLDAPAEEVPQLPDGFAQPILDVLDLTKEGVTTVIWAMGYAFDFGLVRLPVLDGDGFPYQTCGVTRHPGLSFVGLPWMPARKTGIFLGMGTVATHVSSTIARPPEWSPLQRFAQRT